MGCPHLYSDLRIESNYHHRRPPWLGDEERDEDPGTQTGFPGKRTGWSGMEKLDLRKSLAAGRSTFSDRDLRHEPCSAKMFQDNLQVPEGSAGAASGCGRLFPLPTLQENGDKPSDPLEWQRGAKT